MQHELSALLGLDLSAVARSEFVLGFGRPPDLEKVEDRSYLTLPDAGLAFVADQSSKVTSIQLYRQGYQEFKGFTGPLPEGISFEHTRLDVERLLGNPSESGGGIYIQHFGEAPVWDRFDRAVYSLHVQYSKDAKSIDLVSIMSLSAVPRTDD